MAVSMAGFTLNDTIVKAASYEMNMGQVILIRGLFATTLVALLAWHQGALRDLRAAANPMVVARAIGELGGTIFFMIALAHLPIANVSAVLQALPLAVTMGAALFFGETVGWRRWLAITIGFAGVMIIVRPGFEGFSIYAVSALVCVVFCAGRDLATKRIPQHIPSLFVSMLTAIIVTICGGALVVPLGGWTPVSAFSVARLGCGGVLLLVGYQFIIMAMRTGEISFIAPFRYTALLWAIALGFIAFGDVPDVPMIAGSILIVGSGLYALYRERTVGRRRVAAESTSPNMAPDGI